MEVEQLGNGWRLILSPQEYQLVLENATSRDSEIVMRLCAESCLRYSEALEATLQRVEEVQCSGEEVLFYHIPHKEKQVPRLGQDNGRKTILPEDLFDLMEEHVKAEDLSYRDPLIQYCTRSVFNHVKQAGVKTAEQTGKDEFRKLSPHDLRASFVVNAIERFRMHPQVVLEIGGWTRFDSMAAELSEPTQEDLLREYNRHDMRQ